ncbi:MAG: hypothetical protein ACQGVC_23865 [Myxococcota bacterium]
MRWTLLLGLALVLGVPWAPSASGAGDPQADLFAAARVRRHVEAWPEVAAGARDRAAARLDAEAFALLERAVARAFAPERLVAAMDGEALAGAGGPGLAGALDAARAGTLLGPLEGLPPEALREFVRFASDLGGGDLPPPRIVRVRRADETTGFGRNAWRTSSAVALAVARGARALSCSDAAWESPLPPEAGAELEALADPFRERVLVELLFHARGLSGADLQAALAVLEAQPSRRFHRRLAIEVRRALARAGAEVGERLGRESAARCSP